MITPYLLCFANINIDKIEKKKINKLKIFISAKIDSIDIHQDSNQEQYDIKDLSLPGKTYLKGSLHPLTLIINQIKEIFNIILDNIIFLALKFVYHYKGRFLNLYDVKVYILQIFCPQLYS